MDLPKAELKASQILADARDTMQARGQQYADPATNHLRISHLWSTYLERYVSPEQVAMCMALLKIARSMESREYADNYIDAAAYLSISGELATMDWDLHERY